jgi:hypothetical protein
MSMDKDVLTEEESGQDKKEDLKERTRFGKHLFVGAPEI